MLKDSTLFFWGLLHSLLSHSFVYPTVSSCHSILYIHIWSSMTIDKVYKKYISFINLSYYKNMVLFTIFFAIWKSILATAMHQRPLIYVNSNEQGLSSSIQFRFTRTLNPMPQMNLHKF